MSPVSLRGFRCFFSEIYRHTRLLYTCFNIIFETIINKVGFILNKLYYEEDKMAFGNNNTNKRK